MSLTYKRLYEVRVTCVYYAWTTDEREATEFAPQALEDAGPANCGTAARVVRYSDDVPRAVGECYVYHHGPESLELRTCLAELPSLQVYSRLGAAHSV